MLKRQILACILLMLGVLYLGPSSAATLSFSPASSEVGLGGTVNVDVVVSNLPPSDLFGTIPVGAFDIYVNYDSSIITSTGALFSDSLGPPGLIFTDVAITEDPIPGPGQGQVNALNVSFLFDFELADLQGSSFTLATLSFQALNYGTSSLIFDPLTTLLVDALDPTSVIPATFADGEISVIPLPGAVWLMITGLLGIGALARKGKKAA